MCIKPNRVHDDRNRKTGFQSIGSRCWYFLWTLHVQPRSADPTQHFSLSHRLANWDEKIDNAFVARACLTGFIAMIFHFFQVVELSTFCSLFRLNVPVPACCRKNHAEGPEIKNISPTNSEKNWSVIRSLSTNLTWPLTCNLSWMVIR